MLSSIKNKDNLVKNVSDLFTDTLNLLENNKKEKKGCEKQLFINSCQFF